MNQKWIDGNDLLTHLNRKELFEAIKAGGITPYDRENGKKIVDYETLLIVKKGKKNGHRTWRMPTDAELDMTVSPDCAAKFIDIENVTDFIFSKDEVKSFLTSNKPKELIRRTVALSLAKLYKRDTKNATSLEAAKDVNRRLEEQGLAKYSIKQLQRIIRDLNFLPGKPGPKTKK